MSIKKKMPTATRNRALFRSRRFLILTTHASIVFTLSLIGCLLTGYFFLSHVSGDTFRFSDLLRTDLLFPQIAIAMAITLGAGIIVVLTLRRRVSEVEESGTRDFTPPILRLHRHAERLNAAEMSLMVKMSHSDAVDLNTRSILAEMQMCTKRLMGGLADLDREERQVEVREAFKRRGSNEREPAAY